MRGLVMRGLMGVLAGLVALGIGAPGAGAERGEPGGVGAPAALSLGNDPNAAALPQGQRLTITTPSTGLFEMPFITTLRRGFFTEDGFDVNRIQVSPPVAVAALLAGEADYTISAGSSAVAIVGADAPVRIVAGLAIRALHALVTSDPSVQTVADLRGRSVATSTLTDGSAAITRFALRQYGLEVPTDVALQPLGQSPNRLAAMQTGQVQASILDLSHAIEAERHGARMLARPSELPDVPSSGLVATEVRLREQPQQVEGLIRALLKGLRYYHENREDAIRLLMEHLEVDRQVAEGTYDFGLRSFSTDGIIPDHSLQLLLESTELAVGRPASVPTSRLIDFSIVQRLNAQSGR